MGNLFNKERINAAKAVKAWDAFGIQLADFGELLNNLNKNNECGESVFTYEGGSEDAHFGGIFGGGSEKSAKNADIRMQVIKDVARDINKNLIKLNVNPDTGDFRALVQELSAKLPDPDKNKHIKNDPKTQKAVCTSLVNILNSNLKANIDKSLPIAQQCELAFGHIRLLLLGAGAEVFQLYTELRRVVYDLTLLQKVNEAAVNKLEATIKKSKDKSFQRSSEHSLKVLKDVQSSVDSTLRSINHVIARDLDKDYKDVAKIIQSSATNDEAFKKLGLAKDANGHQTAKQLGRSFKELSHLSIMVSRVSDALKKLNISVNEYKNSKNYEEFEQSALKALENLNPSEYKQFFSALHKVIKKSWAHKTKIQEKLGGAIEKLFTEAEKKDFYTKMINIINTQTNYHDANALFHGYADNDTLANFTGAATDNAAGHMKKMQDYINVGVAISDTNINAASAEKITKVYNHLISDTGGKKNHAELSGLIHYGTVRYGTGTLAGETGIDKVASKSTLIGTLNTQRGLQTINIPLGSGDKDYQSKYAKRLNKNRAVQGKIIEAFSKSLKHVIDNMIKNNKQIVGEFRQGKIKIGDDSDEIIRAIDGISELFASAKAKYLNLTLIGYASDVSSKNAREEFMLKLKNLIKTLDNIGTPALKKQASLLQEIIKTIDKYYDVFAKSRKTLSFSRSSIEGGEVYLAGVHEPTDISGGADEPINLVVVAGKHSLLSSGIWELKYSLSEIKYYISMYKIRDNLKISSKIIEQNSKGYKELVGKTVARKINSIHDEWAIVKDNLTKDSKGATKWLSGAGDAAKLTSQKTLSDKFYEVKIDFYKVLEAIETYLTAFTDGIVKHPDDAKDIKNMLNDGEIVFDWYDKSAGDAILNTFEIPTQLTKDKNGNGELDKVIKGKYLNPSGNLKDLSGNMDVIHTSGKSNVELTIDAYRKSFDRLDVLKNLISTFIMIGKKFGGKKIEEETNIPFGEIYRKLCTFLSYSIISPEKVVAANDADNREYFQEFKYKFTAYNSKDGNKYYDFWTEELELFRMMINALSAKVFTVLGLNEMLNRPYDVEEVMKGQIANTAKGTLADQRRYDYVTRLVLGGAHYKGKGQEDGYPEIIPEAIELYVRLPLLVEFYKDILDFNAPDPSGKNNIGKGENQFSKIAMIPDFENIWKDLIEFYYFNPGDLDDGAYGDYDVRQLIRIVNKIYRSYKTGSGKDTTSLVLNEFVAEVNSRMGVVNAQDFNDFVDYRESISGKDRDVGSESVIDFKVIPDQDNEYSLPGESSKYLSSKPVKDAEIKSKDLKYDVAKIIDTDTASPGGYKNIIGKFLNKVYGALNKPEIRKNVMFSGQSISKRISYIKHEFSKQSSNEDKYKTIFSLLKSSGQLQTADAVILVLFHELFIAPFNTLIVSGNLLTKWIKKVTDTNGIISEMNVARTAAKFDVNDLITQLISLNDLSGSMVTIELSKNFCRIDMTKFISHIKESVQLLKTVLGSFESVVKITGFNMSKFRTAIGAFEKDVIETHLVQGKNNIHSLRWVINQIDAGWKKLAISADGTEVYNDNVELVYNTTENMIANSSSVINSFNHIIYSCYVDFSDNLNDKVYGKLFDEFANGVFHSAIYNKVYITSGAYPNDDSIIEKDISEELKKLFTEKISDKINTPKYLYETLSDVPGRIRNKMKTKLPIYESLFKSLISRCNMYFNVVDVLKLKQDGSEAIDNDRLKASINQVRLGCRTMLRCIKSVRSELGDLPEYFEIFPGFSADYKSAYGRDPMKLLSYTSLVLNNKEETAKSFGVDKNNNSNIDISQSSMDNHYKYLHGTVKLFDTDQQGSLSTFGYIKKMLESYNSYHKVTKKLDTSKMDRLIEVNVNLLKFIHKLRYRNMQIYTGNATTVDAESQTYYGDMSNDKTPQMIQMVESGHQREELKLISNSVFSKGGGTTALNPQNMKRSELRVLNIFDMNIVPVNVQALRKEIAFTSLFTYNWAFEHQIDKLLHSQYTDIAFNKDDGDAGVVGTDISNASRVLMDLLKDPYRELKTTEHGQIYNILLGRTDLPLSRPKFLLEHFWEKSIGAIYDQDKNITAVPKPYILTLGQSTNAPLDNHDEAPRFDTTIARNIFYLVNLQRVLRLQMRKDLYWSLGPVVNNLQSISPDVTEISNSRKDYKPERRGK